MIQMVQSNPIGRNNGRQFSIATRIEIDQRTIAEISNAMNALLADSFALYLKTKNFHWNVRGLHFKTHHLLFDEQAEEIFASTDKLAECVRKIGGRTLHSLCEIDRLRRIKHNTRPGAPPFEMLAELIQDNRAIAQALREVRALCKSCGDAASTEMLTALIARAERRNRLLSELDGDGMDGW